MARARNIKPGFFTNDLLAEVQPLGRLLFQGLWCHADKDGRLADRPKKIKAEILPYDDADADLLLGELEKHGFIIRYTVENNKYIQVVNFTKHQNPHIKELASEIPAPVLHQSCTSLAPVLHESSPADSLNPITDSGFRIPDTPKPKPEPKPTADKSALDDGFETFWIAYPRKTGKGYAASVWAKTKPPKDLILQALVWQSDSEQWRKDGGQFVPNPATYLNQKRWLDEPPPTRVSGMTAIGRRAADAASRWLESQEVISEAH